MADLKEINIGLVIISGIGFLISYYAYFVEKNLELNSNYTAYCDISEHMSCSKAFSSRYGKGFGILGKTFGEDSILNQPNSIPGMIFYLVCSILAMRNSLWSCVCLLGLSFGSILMSLYLGYILYFVLYDFCIVCVSTYVVNLILLFLAYFKWRAVNRSATVSSTGASRKKRK